MHTNRKLSLDNLIIQFIKRNCLFEGTRLPSIAYLAKHFRAGKDTVSTALIELQNEGIIEIRKNDGCYIMPTAWELLYKGTPNWVYLLNTSWSEDRNTAMLPTHPDAINISMGHLSDEFGYNKYIAEAVEEAAKIIRSNSFKYDVDPRGRLSFRTTIQKFLKDFKGIECDPSQIIHTLGSNQNIIIIIQSLLNHNTPLCVSMPNALSTMTMIDSYGIKQIEYEENNLESLKSAISQQRRAVFIGSASSNYPTGASTSKEFREGLITYARKRKLPIVEIDSHNDLTEISNITLKAMDTNDSIIYGGTLMNVYTIGIPVNWLVVPMQIVDRFAGIVAQNNVIPATLPQLVVELLLQKSVITDYITQAKRLFHERVTLTKDLLKRHLSQYATWDNNNIGLSAWVEMKDKAYVRKILEDPGLYVLSGEIFGKAWGNFLSICPCNQQEENLITGITRIGELLRNN